MQAVNYFLNKNFKLKLINKFNCKIFKNIFKFKKIILSLKNSSLNFKKISVQLLFINLLTNKIPNYLILKKQKLILKLKFGDIIGYKIVLRKKCMYCFLKKIIFGFLKTKLNNFYLTKNLIFLNCRNIIIFFNFKNYYSIFSQIKVLNLIIITNHVFKI